MAFEKGDLLQVADDGGVEGGLQDLELASKAEIKALNGDAGLAGDGGHGGGQVAVADEQRRPDCCNIAAQLLHGYRK